MIRVWEVLDRKASAWRYFGAALEWRDGIILHTEEVVDLPKLGPHRRAGRNSRIVPTPRGCACRRPPWPSPPYGSTPTSCSTCSTNSFLTTLRDKFENLRTVVQGVALGLDFCRKFCRVSARR